MKEWGPLRVPPSTLLGVPTDPLHQILLGCSPERATPDPTLVLKTENSQDESQKTVLGTGFHN